MLDPNFNDTSSATSTNTRHVMHRLRRLGHATSIYTRQYGPQTIHVQARHNTMNAIINEINTPTPHSTGSLKGKTIAIKDNIVTTSTPTTAASKTIHNYTSPFDATVVELLRSHGASISSKTNLDEFGMGSHSQQSFFGPTVSPFKRHGVALSAGGSSGGSAVAVAQGQVWAALGTDTGGSVRLPAAWTGVVGFKPSYGLLSRWGVIQYANSLDTVGILSRRVADARTVFEALNVFDSQDPTSLPRSVRQRIAARKERNSAKGLRIGVPTSYIISELSPAVRAAYSSTLTSLQNSGHTLIPIDSPTTQQALLAYYILAPAEASSNLAKYDGIRYGFRPPGPDARPKLNMPLYATTRGQGFGDEVQRRILLGAYTLSSEAMGNYFLQAQKIRRLVQQDFDRVFAMSHPLHDNATSSTGDESGKGVDIILTPTAPILPPTIEEVEQQSAVERYMNDVFTVPPSLAGLPAASVPVALPVSVQAELGADDVKTAGMQVIGQFGDDELVLEAAEIVEGLR